MPEARIIVKKRPDGRSEVSVVAPGSDRVIPGGQYDANKVEDGVRRLTEHMRKSGNQTDVLERR